MPFTTTVATVCSEMMMTSEMKTNDTMKKTEDTMEDTPSITSAPDDGRAEAETVLGVSLTSLKIMRLEAQRARDVVDGKKTLELTGRQSRERGMVLIGETADGAIAKGCAIGAVTLGECTRMSQEAFKATADRHHALDFEPAQAWLEKGTMWGQELSGAVRFETPVPYKQMVGARKWLGYRASKESEVDRLMHTSRNLRKP